MSEHPHWLPTLICFPDYDGKWDAYVEALYGVFRRDFIESQPEFRARPVYCQSRPIHDGKEAGFWHCIQQGRPGEERTPNFRRCERIGWPRAIIEHADDPSVVSWSLRKGGDDRTYLWYREEYLVALGDRRRRWQLITAFPTDRRHTREKLRKEITRTRNT